MIPLYNSYHVHILILAAGEPSVELHICRDSEAKVSVSAAKLVVPTTLPTADIQVSCSSTNVFNFNTSYLSG